VHFHMHYGKYVVILTEFQIFCL